MAALFVSHASQDAPLAGRILESLRRAGHEAVFVSSDRARGALPGRIWETSLYSALENAEAVVFIATLSSCGSPWCFAELAMARARGKTIYPLTMGRGVRHPLLGDVQEIDCYSDIEHGLAVLNDLLSTFSGGLGSFGWDYNRPPYPGLQAFQQEDAGVFFGRDREILRLRELLGSGVQFSRGRVLAVAGPSGSGKSSLVRAGLVPLLARSADWIVLRPITLAQGRYPPLQRLLEILRSDTSIQDSSDDIHADSGALEPFLRRARAKAELTDDRTKQSRVLILIDQAERLITATSPQDQAEFIGALSQLTAAGPLYNVVLTLRSDYLSIDPTRSGLATLIDDTLLIEPIERTKLTRIITQPAVRAGIKLDENLAETMVDDTSGGDALPLLAYTLRALYERSPTKFRAVDYLELGGVVGALTRQADIALSEASGANPPGTVLEALMQMVAVGPSNEPITQPRPLRMLSVTDRHNLEHFVDARLVRVYQTDEDATVELTHDAMLRQWAPLREAISASRRALRMRTEIELLSKEWATQRGTKKAGAYLLRNGRLTEYETWAVLNPNYLTDRTREFLNASRRSNRRRTIAMRAVAVLLLTLSLASSIAAVIAIQYGKTANREASVALSRQLEAQASGLRSNQVDLSLLLGVNAVRLSGEKRVPTLNLLTTLANNTTPSIQIVPPGAGATCAAISENGARIAVASSNHGIRLFDMSASQVGPALGEGFNDCRMKFSASGRRIAISDAAGVISIWDTSSNRLVSRFKCPNSRTTSPPQITYDGDNDLIAYLPRTDTVCRWDIKSQRVISSIWPANHFREIAYISPDGRFVVGFISSNTVQVWDTVERRLLGAIVHPILRHLNLSPDGKLLANLNNNDGSATIFRVKDAAVVSTFGVPSGNTHGISFSSDGKQIATGEGSDIVVHNSGSGRELLSLRGHTSGVSQVQFSSDSSRLLSVANDGSVRAWQQGAMLRSERTALPTTLANIAYNEEGTTIAALTDQGQIFIIDGHSGKTLGEPFSTGIEDPHPNCLALSPDAQMVAVCNTGVVTLWSASGQRLASRTLEASVIAFSGTDIIGLGEGRYFTWLTRSNELSNIEVGIEQWRPGSADPNEPTSYPVSASFSADGSTVVWGDILGNVWALNTALPLSFPRWAPPRLGDFAAVSRFLAVNNDRTVLADATQGGTFFVSRASTNNDEPQSIFLAGPTFGMKAMSMTGDGSLLATAYSDGYIRLFDTTTGQLIGQPIKVSDAEVFSMGFTADASTLLVISADGGLWRAPLNPEEVVALACRAAGRNMSYAEWASSMGDSRPYGRTCANWASGN